MTADWVPLAAGTGEVDRGSSTVTVRLDRGRRHDIQVIDRHEAWELSGHVADEEAALVVGLGATDLWRRNGTRKVTGYVVDGAGDVWVTALLPKAGASAEEFRLLALEVSREADRLEYLFTGQDQR